MENKVNKKDNIIQYYIQNRQWYLKLTYSDRKRQDKDLHISYSYRLYLEDSQNLPSIPVYNERKDLPNSLVDKNKMLHLHEECR